MSGHSKWAGIKHKKAIVDHKRGQAFTRASREITIAAKEGGGNPEGNFRLRLAMQKAREINMPTDRIQNAIKRGTGELAGEKLEEIRYEGYGPAGLAVIEAGADDVQVDAKSVEVTTPPQAFERVKAALEALGVTVENAEITMQPKQTVPIGEDKAVGVLRLMESLEEDDDVQQVYANFDIPTNVLERVSAQV